MKQIRISWMLAAILVCGIFGRYKHQTSDRGYWGDLFNLKFQYLYTEIQVKSYRNYYAANPEDICRPVLGDRPRLCRIFAQ